MDPGWLPGSSFCRQCDVAAESERGSAFEELVFRHRDKIYARAFSMMRNEDDAVDLSQEAWVKGWQRLKQFQGESSFVTWMTRIVINLCLDQLRKRKVRKEESPTIETSEGPMDRMDTFEEESAHASSEARASS